MYKLDDLMLIMFASEKVSSNMVHERNTSIYCYFLQFIASAFCIDVSRNEKTSQYKDVKELIEHYALNDIMKYELTYELLCF
jgi:hypothetical protein